MSDAGRGVWGVGSSTEGRAWPGWGRGGGAVQAEGIAGAKVLGRRQEGAW